jgi:hypothetical protein
VDVTQGYSEMISAQVTKFKSCILVTEVSSVSSFRVSDFADAVFDAARIHKRYGNVLARPGSTIFHSGNLELALGPWTVGKEDFLHL